MTVLPVLDAADVDRLRPALPDAEVEAVVSGIVADVAARGIDAVQEHAVRLGDLESGDPLVLGAERLAAALGSLDADDRQLLGRTARRIARFAEHQLESLREISVDVPGGRAGHRVSPVAVAGCYAPGGRFPLPSTVLMTAVTARVAGVESVWVASPRPSPVTLAAAAVAGADAVLAVGGAQAIAAFAHGAGEVPACDVVVGPGNRWVTAAKSLIAPEVRIDLVAGPSELVVLADESADPALVAADLLAQAEHDTEAASWLITASEALVGEVEEELVRRLVDLPTAEVARAALAGAGVVLCDDLDSAATVCDRIAAEHVQIHAAEAASVAERLTNYGALFIGAPAAHVFGDYGAGPNHVLPTAGTARARGGLSVLSFLKVATWMELAPGPELDALAADAARLARLEGLEAHARAADARVSDLLA
jgi:phosphoribosyl-ATP pyrophosphohydrolase/phosphoribosyl-AMP cyclohydrolase/histidinol dehydrogenase